MTRDAGPGVRRQIQGAGAGSAAGVAGAGATSGAAVGAVAAGAAAPGFRAAGFFARCFVRLMRRARRARFTVLLYCLPIWVFTSLNRFGSFLGSMSLRLTGFNIYLLAAALLALSATGCKSSEEKKKDKEASSLRLYLETEFDTTGDKTAVVPVFRDSPVLVRISKEPVLDEGHIIDARVADIVGGFIIQVKFDFRGTLVLESVTSTYRGQRLVIYSMFNEGRWLAAPKIATSIKDGTLTFTPDATREEADRIVRGLNNVAVKLGNKPKPGKEEPPEDK